MRSIVLALSFALPCSALAAPTYTRPLVSVHEAKPKMVMLTFASRTAEDRELHVGNDVVKLRPYQRLNVAVTVGATVLVYSDQNSKVHGLPLLQVANTDGDRTVEVR